MKRVDVEPLSEERWKRIEQGVFRALDAAEAPVSAQPAPRRALWLSMAFAGGAAALAILALLFFRAPNARELVARDVQTEAETQQIALGPHHLALAPHGRLSLRRGPAGEPLVTVQQGTVDFDLDASDAGAVDVRAGELQLRASGARFRVVYLAAQARVEVQRASVTLRVGPRDITLRAGDQWPARVAPTQAAPQRSAGATPERESVSDDRAFAPAAANPVKARLEPPRQDGAAPERRRAQPAQVASRQTRYEEAARMEGASPEAAERMYAALAAGRDGWAANALFALGRLQLERGQDGPGRATLRAYLSRYPRGHNAEDARRLLKPTD